MSVYHDLHAEDGGSVCLGKVGYIQCTSVIGTSIKLGRRGSGSTLADPS
jgi:hypothetical protein